MSAPKTPEECLVLNGAGGPKWAETREAIDAYAAAKVAEATEALRKEVADLRARIEAAHAAWAVDSDAEALLSSDVDMVLLEPADIDRLTRALDLTREWGGA